MHKHWGKSVFCPMNEKMKSSHIHLCIEIISSKQAHCYYCLCFFTQLFLLFGDTFDFSFVLLFMPILYSCGFYFKFMHVHRMSKLAYFFNFFSEPSRPWQWTINFVVISNVSKHNIKIYKINCLNKPKLQLSFPFHQFKLQHFLYNLACNSEVF